MESDGIYRKHNSFVELYHRHEGVIQTALSRIAALRSSGAAEKGLDKNQTTILGKALENLFSEVPEKDNLRFALTANVASEIATLDDIELARYIVHRYRYEMYPQLQVLDDYPPCLQIEPSSICNYRCVFCFQTDKFFTRKSNGFMGYMTLDTFKHAIDQAVGNIEFISLASRGEPLICPTIEDMLAYTRGKFFNLKMNTNAFFLDERKAHSILQSGIKTLVFSIDAAEEPLYSQLRVNGNLEKVLANIKRFQAIRHTQYPDSPIITRVSGVMIGDRQEMGSMQKRWGDLVDQVAFVKYNHWENVYNAAPTGINNLCSDLWRRMFVWWDGKVNPCDVDYRSTLSVGNIAEENISGLWRSAGYERLREFHVCGNRSDLTICTQCTVV